MQILWMVFIAYALTLTVGSARSSAQIVEYDTAADEYAGVLIGEAKNDYLTSNADSDPHGALLADINGDGYDDVIVGSLGYGSYGRVYVQFGAEGLSGELDLAAGADFTVSGTSTSGDISASLAAGDLNDDDIADLVIGSSDSTGTVYIVFGSALHSGELSVTSADVIIQGQSSLTKLGNDSAIGDVNGDGIGDLIIGAPYHDVELDDESVLSSAGAVHVLYGSSSWPATIDLTTTPADVTFYGNNEDDRETRIGTRIAVGNLNGDDYDDIIFGHCQAHVEGWDDAGYPGYPGVYWGIMGSASLDTTYHLFDEEYDFKVYGKGHDGSGTSAYNIGEELAIGDINGDDYDDLILSTISYGGAPTGVSVIPGSASFTGDGNIEDLRTATFSFPDGNEGYGAIAVGDINGTLIDDLILGNPSGTPQSRWLAGEVYIFRGHSGIMDSFDIEADADIVIQGSESSDAFGMQIATGDIDDDGRADLLVGAATADYGSRSNPGKAYYFMGSDLALTDGVESVPSVAPWALLGLGVTLGSFGIQRMRLGQRSR
ncbi:integrin alpha [Myxococcota bacterium]|nr:integrin alpha [Myxococcota bacterium]